MAAPTVYRCIICGLTAATLPKHCPGCGVPGSRWRLVVDRKPLPAPPAG